ncbi:hypothetical protein Q4Q34_06530 [Flavivirga abyssicola]|uniref:hypothetical protein n=1 Tax=Flavivirga abyssicola TaxID=3063533 RepID=UPI0026E0CC02|nr:hypothetical protein [Flavivirga sp. MEBiC07777]WVK14683.1 hypothetical protein Q4Q34_06530 [Flavivirga sp. MEBiC07777]
MKKVIKKMVLGKPYKENENVSLINIKDSKESTLNFVLYLTMLLLILPIIIGFLLLWFEIK